MQINGHIVPSEIALMNRIGPCDQVMQLIDWYERPDSYVIIMERPETCQDLFDYITERKILDEDTARTFLWQVRDIEIKKKTRFRSPVCWRSQESGIQIIN